MTLKKTFNNKPVNSNNKLVNTSVKTVHRVGAWPKSIEFAGPPFSYKKYIWSQDLFRKVGLLFGDFTICQCY